MKEIKVGKNESGQRLDKLLLKYLNQASSSFVYKMLRKKNIVLNDKKASGSEKLLIGDSIKIYLSDETFNKFSKADFKIADNKKLKEPDVVYEDENILVANKPAGTLSQKAKPEDISINEEIIAYLMKNGSLKENDLKTFKPSICNRLDRNTSGLIIFGKTLLALQTMGQLLNERTVEKYYYCLVKGRLEEEKTIEGYLKKLYNNKVIIMDDRDSESLEDKIDYIKTLYMPVISNESYTLLKVKLITGKPHQIRAHLASINHPIVGDAKYGDMEINKNFKEKYKLNFQLLHSAKLIFPKLEGDLEKLSNLQLDAKLPDYFIKILKGENLDGYLEK